MSGGDAVEYWERLREWLTDQWRPYQATCLPEELSFPDGKYLQIDATRMLRDARLNAACNFESGVFQILGQHEAQQAACIWSPVTRLITEEVSLAFCIVDRQRTQGEIVSERNKARLETTLRAYFKSMGRPQAPQEIRAKIDVFLAEKSLADAGAVSPVKLPVAINLPLLDELRKVNEEIQSRYKDYHGRPATLWEVGLGLDERLDDGRYGHCTPLNCRTFAGTGGDGHHFSLLVQDGQIDANSPVVATAPDNFGDPSRVIALSLYDFLCMGCLKGYDSLGHIFLRPEEEWSEYLLANDSQQVDEHIFNDCQREILGYMRERLKLTPWTDCAAVNEARKKYQALLQHPPDAIF